ncbi:hypothetical protein, partial [Escherichia coli]|uniref:hypothetical protein n=1 Tax=Escherichia coli TaxID=562 RepID=UPI0011251358
PTSGEKRVFLVILFTSFSGSLVSRIPGAVHSQPVNQHSEHEPESASRVKRDLSEVEFESTMKRKRFM